MLFSHHIVDTDTEHKCGILFVRVRVCTHHRHILLATLFVCFHLADNILIMFHSVNGIASISRISINTNYHYAYGHLAKPESFSDKQKARERERRRGGEIHTYTSGIWRPKYTNTHWIIIHVESVSIMSVKPKRRIAFCQLLIGICVPWLNDLYIWKMCGISVRCATKVQTI